MILSGGGGAPCVGIGLWLEPVYYVWSPVAYSWGKQKKGAQQTGDVFSSGGGGTPVDPRKYVSPDGRFLDRCAYDTATIPDNPYTRMYGMPDHVPIDVEIMKQYARCAVDACAINKKAVCWGKTSRQYPSPPSSPDSFNSNGFTNCQADVG